jgi:hypothetical protein
MREIINEIDVLIENTGYSINKNDIDIDQIKNINNRLKHIRSKLQLFEDKSLNKSLNELADISFIVCEMCGNKRCPHAMDKKHQCTNSNMPNQVGKIHQTESK